MTSESSLTAPAPRVPPARREATPLGAARPEIVFRRNRHIRFSDCDPAGIVFYPQYFVMLNDLVEAWFSDGLGIAYPDLVVRRRIGLPSVRLEVDFTAVSRMGDEVELALGVERLGGASLTLAHTITGAGGERRMAMRQVLVSTALDTHRAVELPSDVRAAIARLLPAAS